MDPNKNPFDLFHSSFCILGVRVVVQMHNCEVHKCLCNLWWLRQFWEFAGSIFEDTHRGRVCIRVFIGVSVRALWVSWVVLCNLKKKILWSDLPIWYEFSTEFSNQIANFSDSFTRSQRWMKIKNQKGKNHPDACCTGLIQRIDGIMANKEAIEHRNSRWNKGVVITQCFLLHDVASDTR